MLVVDPQKRATSKSLCEKLDNLSSKENETLSMDVRFAFFFPEFFFRFKKYLN